LACLARTALRGGCGGSQKAVGAHHGAASPLCKARLRAVAHAVWTIALLGKQRAVRLSMLPGFMKVLE
jgi:hypothetical protein